MSRCQRCDVEIDGPEHALCAACWSRRRTDKSSKQLQSEFPLHSVSRACLADGGCIWATFFARRFRAGPEEVVRILEGVDELLLVVQHRRLVDAKFIQLASRLDALSRLVTFAEARGKQ